MAKEPLNSCFICSTVYTNCADANCAFFHIARWEMRREGRDGNSKCSRVWHLPCQLQARVLSHSVQDNSNKAPTWCNICSAFQSYRILVQFKEARCIKKKKKRLILEGGACKNVSDSTRPPGKDLLKNFNKAAIVFPMKTPEDEWKMSESGEKSIWSCL